MQLRLRQSLVSEGVNLDEYDFPCNSIQESSKDEEVPGAGASGEVDDMTQFKQFLMVMTMNRTASHTFKMKKKGKVKHMLISALRYHYN